MTLDNLTLGTLNAESVDNTFMDDAMNPLGGLNIPPVENIQAAENQPVQESAEQQDPPGKKKSVSKELQDLDNQQKQLTKNWSNTSAFLAQTKRDPRLAAGAYQYDQFVTNVDRYRGYGKSTFNKLGFNPLEDNEKLYNENTSWYQDYYRMSSHLLGMWGSSFVDVSTPKALYNLFTPSSVLAPGIVDLEASENQSRHMKQGGSQRGGLTEWGNNFLLNSAYSLGIISNVMAEEMAIATATALSAPETGGASVAAGAVATAENLSKLARIGKAWREGMAMTSVGSLGRMARSGGQMLTSLNKADAARSFWQGAKGLGNAAVDFVNPLRGTTAALKGMSGATLQLSNAAKFSKGFGAFYRDVREFNYTINEARLEAGGVYDRFVEEQIGKIRKEGREPSDVELQDIYEYARQASEIHGWSEIPIIFATNRITFDGLFRFKGIKALTEAAEAAEKSAAKGIMFDAASRSFKEIPKVGIIGQIGRTVKNPRLYLGSLLKYTRANWSEGFQELVQESSADGIVKYYSQLYDNPENGNADYLKGSIYSAFDEQIFSKQGVSTFMSGFLMGGLLGGASKSALNVLTKAQEAYLKKTDPEKFQQYQEQKIRVKKELLNSMNQLISDPERFFSPAKESFINQKRGNDNMLRADMQEDDKAFVDAKDDKIFDHVFTALNRGTFGMVIDGMKEMGKLNEAEIAEAMNLPTENGVKAKDKVSEYVKRAEQIKGRYEYFQDKMPNPFKPGKFQKGSIEHVQEFLSYKAFDDARKSAIASQYGFDRSLERMNNITRELSEDRPLQNSSATDITVLLNEKDLNEEIKLLRREIKTTGEETADQKAIIKQKTKRLEALEDYKKNLKEYKSVRGTTKITEDGQIELFQDYDSEQALRKSYEAYLRNIAKLNNDYVFDDKISSSFKKVMDFYELDEDSKSYNATVNNLLNPENFKRHTERIFNTLSDIFNNREQIVESSIDKYLSANELNALTIALGKLGIIIKPEEILELYNSGLVPSTFLDMRSNKQIDRNDPRYEAILEIIGSFKDIQEEGKPVQQPPVTEAASQSEQATQQEEAPTNIDAGIPAELAVKLEDAYNRYIEETGSDISYDDFVENSITAARIKEQFNNGQTQPAATQAAATSTTAAVLQPNTTPVATATGTSRTEPVVTQTSVSDKKADIERRRQEELFNTLGDKESFDKIKDLVNTPITKEVAQTIYERFNNGKDVVRLAFKNGSIESDGEGIFVIYNKGVDGYNNPFRLSLADKKMDYQGSRKEMSTPTEFGQPIIPANYQGDNVDTPTRKSSQTKFKEINAKYDAELAALEGAKPAEQASGLTGVEISSNAKGLAAALTNPTELAKSKGNLAQSYPVEFRGKTYKDAEAAYQALKNTATKDDGPNSTYNLMIDIIKAKLQQYPRLVESITKEGGSAWILASTHQPTNKNTVWETGGKNWFIQALNEAYTSVITTPKTQESAPVEKTGIEKAQERIDSVSSIRDLFDMNSEEAVQIINEGVTSKELREMLQKKREELVKNISTNDLQKFDIVSLKDGSKVVYVYTKKGKVHVKTQNDGKGEYTIMNEDDFVSKIENVEPAKNVSMEPTQAAPVPDITEQDKNTVNASKDSMNSFVNDAARLKKTLDDVMNQSPNQDGKSAEDDLLDSLGCDTQK